MRLKPLGHPSIKGNENLNEPFVSGKLRCERTRRVWLFVLNKTRNVVHIEAINGDCLVRLIGQLCIVVGLFFAILGIGLWGVGADITLPAGKIWFELDRASLSIFQSFVQRYINPELWNVLVVSLLLRPTWEAISIIVIFLALLGGGLVSLGRRRRTTLR